MKITETVVMNCFQEKFVMLTSSLGIGLWVQNARGDTWQAFGDDNLILPANQQNYAFATEVRWRQGRQGDAMSGWTRRERTGEEGRGRECKGKEAEEKKRKVTEVWRGERRNVTSFLLTISNLLIPLFVTFLSLFLSFFLCFFLRCC